MQYQHNMHTVHVECDERYVHIAIVCYDDDIFCFIFRESVSAGTPGGEDGGHLYEELPGSHYTPHATKFM